MITGMLWFDNEKKTTFSSKVDQAAKYYRKKYGHPADICYVHPQMVSGETESQSTKLEVKVSSSILLHHFWLGTKKPAEEDK
jgi:hypothetical protein